MAIIDAQARFSKAQTLALAAGTYLSTNSYDTLSANNDIGMNNGDIAVYAEENFAGGTNVTIEYIESANADMSSPTVLYSSGAIVTANLTIAKNPVHRFKVPHNSKRYVGLRYTTVGIYTAGKITAAYLTDDPRPRYLPSNTGR